MSRPFRFDLEEFTPRSIFDVVTQVRVERPDIISARAAARRRRPRLTKDGKLTILACDHPQRGVTRSGDDPLIMGNRHQYLGRALRVLADPSFDGVMAPPDIMEDLFIIDELIQRGGGPSFLDGRVLIGCMQRGGVAGVAGEINDRFGAYSADSITAARLDGGKMMFRYLPDDEDTLLTIDYCAQAVSELHRRGLYAFVEPLPQQRVGETFKNAANPAVLIKLINVSAALGESSQYTWLKIPYVEGFEQVVMSTTLPILMLGGEATGDLVSLFRNFSAGMRAGTNVRGAMVGRNVLFPGDGDPLAAARAVHAVVHQGLDADEALSDMSRAEGSAMDALTRWIK